MKNVFAFFAAAAAMAAQCAELKAPDHLTVERLADPVGIESRSPRFGWGLGEGFVRQKSYRILVASSPEKLEAGEGDLWDSGDVQSDDSVDIVYAGRPLGDSVRAWWKVQVSEWQGSGMAVSPWSRPSRFTIMTGLSSMRSKVVNRRPQLLHSRRRRMERPSSLGRESITRLSMLPQ